MEEGDYRDMLESKRFDIIQNLHAERTYVFDYLRSKGVLDAEDCELVHSEKTTPRKVGKFVDILARKGPDAYGYLLESLQLENPILFEKLTGEKANATTSPIMTKLKNSYLGVGDPLGNGELEILSKHLERTYGDLHEMSCRFEKVVQRKNTIEDRLETTIDDLRRNQEKVQDLQKKIDSERGTSSIHHTHLVKCLQYMDTLRKEKSDRDIYIIALQTKLMSAREEVVDIQKKNNNMNTKNEELQSVINDVNESYKKKKCESLRLNERIQMQGDEIKKAEQITRKYRQCQFKNMKIREERDRLQADVDELHKWTKALKIRFDVVESEKEKTMTGQAAIIADFGSVHNELTQCKDELSEEQSLASDLAERVRHLEEDRDGYKKQRDAALTARRDAILDRDKAYIERDQAQKTCNELKANNEANIEYNIVELKGYDEVVARNDVIEEEVNLVKMKLRQTQRELEELKMKCGVDDTQQQDDDIQENSAEIKPAENEVGAIQESKECPGENNDVTKLLESIKRRVEKPPITSSSPNTSVMSFEHFFPPYAASQSDLAGTFPFTNAAFPERYVPHEPGLLRNKQTRQPIRGRRCSSDSPSNVNSQQPPGNNESNMLIH